MDNKTKYILESLIFTSGKPIKIKKLIEIVKSDDKIISDEIT